MPADYWTPEKTEKFLEALRAGGSVAMACRASTMSRASAYWRRDKEPEFRDAWLKALEDGTDGLEDALHLRAKRDDTTAAIFLLKARRPEIYRETIRQEHTGKDGAGIILLGIPTTPEAQEELLKRLHKERAARLLASQAPREIEDADRADPAG